MLYKLIAILFVVFGVHQSFAVDKAKIDSLINVLNTSSKDSARFDAYIHLGTQYRYVDTDSSLLLSNQAYELAKEMNWLEGKAKSKMHVGVAYLIKGDYSIALTHSLECLKYSEQSQNEKLISKSLGVIGVIYKNLKEYDRALEYYDRALNRALKDSSYSEIAMNYGNIGVVYKKINQLDSALYYYDKALAIWKDLESKANIAMVTGNMGSLYKKKGEYKKAINFSETSYSMYLETGQMSRVARQLLNLSGSHYKLGNYTQAQNYIEEGIEIAEKVKSKRLLESLYKYYASILEKKGELKAALKYTRLSAIYRDSIFNDKAEDQVLKAELKFEYEKKAYADSLKNEKEKAIYETNLELSEEKLKREQTQRYFMYVGIGVLVSFLGFVFNRYQVTKKQKKIIDDQRKDVEKQKMKIEQQHLLLEEKNNEIVDSINYAKRIQNVILPEDIFNENILSDHFVLFKPKDVVSGDFYWSQEIGDTTYYAVADCTGHGVPGALVSVMCYNALNRSLKEYNEKEPGSLLNQTRDVLLSELAKSNENINDGMDISLVAIQRNEDSNSIKVNWAGANNPLWVVSSNKSILIDGTESESKSTKNENFLYELKPDKQPIGYYKEKAPFTNRSLELNKDDIIYLFSDGYQDQFGGEKGKKLKVSSLRELILTYNDKSLDEQKQLLNDTFSKWKGDYEQVDDICIMGLKLK